MALTSSTGDSTGGSGPVSDAAAIFADQVRLLYRMSRPEYVGTVVNAAVIVFALWNVALRPLLLAWLALTAVVTTARYVLYRKFSAAAPPPTAVGVWADRFILGATAMGCTWGLLGSLLLPAGEVLHQFLIVFLVGGMVAAALVVLTPVRMAYVGFMLPALVPLTIAVFAQGTSMHIDMGILLLVFSAVMLGTFPVMYRTDVAALRTRFENRELVERLTLANREVADANRQLIEQIGNQKTIEDALHYSTARLEALIAASPLAIIVQNERGVVKRWNPAAECIFGWTEQEAVGRIAPHIPADQHESVASNRELVMRGKQLADVEVMRLRKDGRLIPVSVSVAPLHDAEGQASGVVAIIADISERWKSEQLRRIKHTVTGQLAESRSVEEAIPQVLRTIGEMADWMCGARWVLNQHEQRLQCMEVWHVDQPAVAGFAEANLHRTDIMDPGAGGLLRRVWRSGEAVWIPDLAADGTLRRVEDLLHAGLRSAFAFPILVAGKFYGVIEFFAPQVRAQDGALMRVSATIGSQIGQFIARKEAESHLTFFANHDVLTGLPNRAMFNQQLTRALARAQRYAKKMAVLFIDLDRFKVINDTLGHDAGDGLLKQLSGRLRDCLREGDTIGRQGGDEFVVLIEDVPEAGQLTGVAQKILETVARPYVLSDQELHVTASIGISVYPDDGADLQTLLKNADIAMYRAKEQGKNNFQFYSAQMNLHTFERLAMESSLRRAIMHQEFLLHYQPKIDMRSGRITGVEALVRWQHPDLGMVPPAQFIALAEETGLITPIGKWVLRTACAEARAWVMRGLPATSVAVNLSARQFGREDLAGTIAGVLRDTGLDPRLLELEITESAVMQNAERAAQVLLQVKQIGVRVAIDDFGTGYSSLGYLKRFPIDSVKIDRSFVLNIPEDKDDVAITRAVIAMAHSLRLKVIAEGVETREQFHFLRDHDCDEIQGYYFSKPVDAAALAGLLAAAQEGSNLLDLRAAQRGDG